MSGFFTINRTEATTHLMRDKNAFALLTLIAYRAKWSDSPSIFGLKKGEARIGDPDACGLTPKEYVTAKQRLEKAGLAAFKGTNKGTVATLLTTDVFEIQARAKGQRQTNEGKAEDNQRATNKEGKKEIEGKGPKYPSDLEKVIKAKEEQFNKLNTKHPKWDEETKKRYPKDWTEFQFLKESKRKLQDQFAHWDETHWNQPGN